MRRRPSVGHRTLSRFTTYVTNCGNLLIGPGSCTSECRPTSSIRCIHEDIVPGSIRKVSAVWTAVQPCAARSSKMAMRCMGRYCGRRCGAIRRIRASLRRSTSRSNSISFLARSRCPANRILCNFESAAQLRAQMMAQCASEMTCRTAERTRLGQLLGGRTASVRLRDSTICLQSTFSFGRREAYHKPMSARGLLGIEEPLEVAGPVQYSSSQRCSLVHRRGRV